MAEELTGELISKWISYKLYSESVEGPFFSQNVSVQFKPSEFQYNGPESSKKYLKDFFNQGNSDCLIEIISSKMDIQGNILVENLKIALTSKKPTIEWLFPKDVAYSDLSGKRIIVNTVMSIHFSSDLLDLVSIDWNPQELEQYILPEGSQVEASIEAESKKEDNTIPDISIEKVADKKEEAAKKDSIMKEADKVEIEVPKDEVEIMKSKESDASAEKTSIIDSNDISIPDNGSKKESQETKVEKDFGKSESKEEVKTGADTLTDSERSIKTRSPAPSSNIASIINKFESNSKDTESKPESRPVSRPSSKSSFSSKSIPEVDSAKPEADSNPVSVDTPISKPELNSNSEPKDNSTPKPETNLDPIVEDNSNSKVETDSNPIMEDNPISIPEADSNLKPEEVSISKPEAIPKPETNSKPKPEGKVKPRPKVVSNSKPTKPSINSNQTKKVDSSKNSVRSSSRSSLRSNASAPERNIHRSNQTSGTIKAQYSPRTTRRAVSRTSPLPKSSASPLGNSLKSKSTLQASTGRPAFSELRSTSYDATSRPTIRSSPAARNLTTSFSIGSEPASSSEASPTPAGQDSSWAKSLRPYLNKGSTGVRL